MAGFPRVCICPLMSTDSPGVPCVEDECAWWLNAECAVRGLTREVENIGGHIQGYDGGGLAVRVREG